MKTPTHLLLVFIAFAGQAANWDSTRGLVLKGDVVTMDAALTVIADGRVVIQNDRIIAVLRPDEPLPTSVNPATAQTVDTQGFILPGLIDAHNHVDYNMLPLWAVPKRYSNRYQWAGVKQYQQDITNPKTLLTGDAFLKLGVEVIKYGEVKAILGGESAIQGSSDLLATRFLVRNIENPNFGSDRIYTQVLSIDDRRFQAETKDRLLALMDQGLVDAWLVHLAEGTDAKSRNEFATLKRLKLLRDVTVVIHGTALESADFREMAQAGAKLIWSPLSNLLLYGKTTDIRAALAAGVLVSLGADWSPSGSKNLLGELKIAHEYDKSRWGHILSDVQLVQMVTVNPATAMGLDDKIGQIKTGYYADLAVFARRVADPYRNLVEATERDVRLVVVGGVPYYGDVSFMQQLKGQDYERLSVQGADKAIDVTDPAVPLGTETLGEIQGRLAKALLADSSTLRQAVGSGMAELEFDQFLHKKLPGLHAVALDGLLPDEAFFGALRRSSNANLGFDIAQYWVRPAGPDDTDTRMLNLVNDAASTVDFLDRTVGLNQHAARSIVQHRDGPDGTPGTADDRKYETIAALDQVPYVGRSTLALLRGYAAAHPQ